MQSYDPYTYWESAISDTPDVSAVGHPELGSYNRVAYRLRLATLRRAVAAVCPAWPMVSVCDAAFGVGYYLDFYARAGVSRVAGIDLSPTAVRRAQARFPDYDLFQHDLAQPLPLSPRSFDLVTAIDVLYHIVDDARWELAVENLCALVSEKGALLITDKFPRDSAHQTFAHVRRRPLAMYDAVLKRSSLKLERIWPVFVFMDDPITVGRPRWLALASAQQWRVVHKTIRLFGRWPALRDAIAITLACVQLPFEKAALGLVSRSPNLEMLVARRA